MRKRVSALPQMMHRTFSHDALPHLPPVKTTKSIPFNFAPKLAGARHSHHSFPHLPSAPQPRRRSLPADILMMSVPVEDTETSTGTDAVDTLDNTAGLESVAAVDVNELDTVNSANLGNLSEQSSNEIETALPNATHVHRCSSSHNIATTCEEMTKNKSNSSQKSSVFKVQSVPSISSSKHVCMSDLQRSSGSCGNGSKSIACLVSFHTKSSQVLKVFTPMIIGHSLTQFNQRIEEAVMGEEIL